MEDPKIDNIKLSIDEVQELEDLELQDYIDYEQH